MSCTGVRQPVIMVSRANDRAGADRFREVLEHFKVIDDTSPPCLLGFEGHFRFYQNRTFDFIESGLSDLSEMLGQDRATIHLRLDGERPRAIALQSPFKVQSHPTRPRPGFLRPP